MTGNWSPHINLGNSLRLFICHKLLFSSCYAPDTGLGAEDTKIMKTKALLSSCILTSGETEGKINNYSIIHLLKGRHF